MGEGATKTVQDSSSFDNDERTFNVKAYNSEAFTLAQQNTPSLSALSLIEQPAAL